MSHALDLRHSQNLKACSNQSEDSDDDSEFYAFVEEVYSKWYDLITYD